MDLALFLLNCLFNFLKYTISLIISFVSNNLTEMQTLIAFIALIMAVFGYLKIIEQLEAAKKQSEESSTQTQHYASQVKEAAEQTKYAVEQLKISNLQIEEQIANRELLEKIRNSELRLIYVESLTKTIEICQSVKTTSLSCLKTLEDTIKFLDLDTTNLDYITKKKDLVQREIDGADQNINNLIGFSVQMSGEGVITSSDLERNIITVNLIYLSALRVCSTNKILDNEIKDLWPKSL